MAKKHIITYNINGNDYRHVTSNDHTAWLAMSNAAAAGAYGIGMRDEETDEPDTLPESGPLQGELKQNLEVQKDSEPVRRRGR